MVTKLKTREDRRMYNSILILSSWGFVIVIASFLFLYLGHLLDEVLGTAPNFMLGLFFLALFTSIGRLYQEAWLKRKDF
ncbi:MAG TPA: AtpZ/AtpI family protein [Syntrophales bacterium]|nr:AtpZ/AtpI family protein [Syntrophales bacterium]